MTCEDCLCVDSEVKTDKDLCIHIYWICKKLKLYVRHRIVLSEDFFAEHLDLDKIQEAIDTYRKPCKHHSIMKRPIQLRLET